MARPRVLAVDDDPRVLASWRLLLSPNFEVVAFGDPRAARAHFDRERFDAALIDLQMPSLDGLALLTQLRASQPDCAAIMVTGHGTVRSAVTALQLGAADFLLKPIDDPEELAGHIHQALRGRRALPPEPGAAPGHAEERLVGGSPVMQGIRTLLARIAKAMAPTLILGESGTGKELAARALHAQSPRAGKPFVALNCAGLTETLIDSELFGHERGAFTGANTRHPGLFTAADGGVLFLDEVGELPPALQAKLLRTLQEGEVRPVGSVKTQRVSVWVVAATNRHLGQAIVEGRFRADLYYRLSTFCVEMPPLRLRREDLPEIADDLLRRLAERTGRPRKALDEETRRALAAYPWPGNVRELANVLEYAASLDDQPTIGPQALPHPLAPVGQVVPALEAYSPEGQPLPRYPEAKARLIAEFDRRYLAELLRQTGGNLSEAARRSGIDRTNLRRLLKQHGLRLGASGAFG